MSLEISWHYNPIYERLNGAPCFGPRAYTEAACEFCLKKVQFGDLSRGANNLQPALTICREREGFPKKSDSGQEINSRDVGLV
jgi:hypothetical protein